MHIIIDGQITKHLDDPKAIESFIRHTASSCGMQILSGPHTAEVTDHGFEDGWSSVAIIKQSTITVHIFSLAQYIYIDVFTCGPKPDIDKISTSYAERHNLTMRMGMRRFTRLTNAFSKKIENHMYAIALYFMHYNFARPHKTLANPYPRTPAMAVGITDHIWTIEEIVKLAN